MSVVIGWMDNGNTAGQFTQSVANLAAYEAVKGRLTTTLRVQSGPQMCEGRNLLVEDFLATDGQWLLMVDTDMVFTHTAVEDLMRNDARVVGGLCFGVNKEFGQFPSMYQNQDGLPVVMLDYPQGSVEVDATGAAFLLTHRTVFENHRRNHIHTWFHRREIPPTNNHPGGILGEDLSWCWWLRENDVKIIVDTTVEIGHMKLSTVGTRSYEVLHASH